MYLVFPFCFSELCSFPHVDLVHILLELLIPKDFIYGGANVNDTVLLISTPLVNFWYMGK